MRTRPRPREHAAALVGTSEGGAAMFQFFGVLWFIAAGFVAVTTFGVAFPVYGTFAVLGVLCFWAGSSMKTNRMVRELHTRRERASDELERLDY